MDSPLCCMDSVLHSALEEICYGEDDGVHLINLWLNLTSSIPSLQLSPAVKQLIWDALVQIPGLKFDGATASAVSSSLKECEQRNIKIVAPQPMWKTFQGTYGIDSTLSQTQRLIIQKLTLARANGIAQSELSKELSIAPNNLFYQLKTLEMLGLIVRYPTILRTKQHQQGSDTGESRNDSVVTTNMIYLQRHAKDLGCQQRLEIRKEEDSIDMTQSGNDFSDTLTESEDVSVKDFLPGMKDICDALQRSVGKVLVVSDIKRDLGYHGRGRSAHKAWRQILHRLVDAQFVEECCTMVNKKMVKCLRLLKSFSPSHFEPKVQGCRHDDINMEQSTSSVKRRQTSEQLVELPILRQIYDMIDASGSKGLTNTEVCEGLGLENKEYHKRYLNNRIFRFGLHSQLEFHNRSKIYRHFTAGNVNLETSNMSPAERKKVVDTPTSMGNVGGMEKSENDASVIKEAPEDKNVDDEGESNLVSHSDAELNNGVPHEEPLLVNNSVTGNDQLGKSSPVVVTPPRSLSHLRYPHLVMEREERILKMLEGQEDKFLIEAELHRHLEKKNNSMMDIKTLRSSLLKLEEKKQCKLVQFPVPIVTNCGRGKTRLVVLHPSVFNISPQLSDQINDKLIDFEIQLRKQSRTQQTRGKPLTVLGKVHRLPNIVKLAVQSESADVMHTNGFVMVRTKLLHIYLWSWVMRSNCVRSPSNDGGALLSTNHASGLKNPQSSCKLFKLDVAVKSMPLELFLQVVGSRPKFKDMVEKSLSTLLLSDLPIPEYNCLMDTRTSGRLSRLIDILRRLKLIRLVSQINNNDSASGSCASLTHALELRPYIEEPVSTIVSCGFLCPDLRPNHRHDFVLRSKKDVDIYWDNLEFFYSSAKPEVASQAFPGSAVREVIHSRSWTSAIVVTEGQRAEVLMHVAKEDLNKKLSFSECEKIAKDLGLTLAQVLHVYYDKRKQLRVSDAKGDKIPLNKDKHIISPRKRKRYVSGVSSKLVKVPVLTTSEDHECDLEERECTGNDIEDAEDEPELNEEDNEACTLLRRSLSRLHPARHKRFLWTEEADRKLVIEYAKHRAERGANFNRIDWASVPNLPALPSTCKRRMSSLKSCDSFRKALMQLCEKLAIRKYPEKFQDKMPNHVIDFEKTVKWDDFDDDDDIKEALNEVLRLKKMAKLEIVKDTFSDQENELNDFEDCARRETSGHTSSSRKLPRKYVKLLNEGASRKLMHESVAIANAVELFKLIFLSSSTASQVPEFLEKTLRRYSEHDLYSAFDYLRERKFMIGGSCDSPFGISRQFLHNISPPEFPKGTGKKAATFASWVHEKEKNLMEEGVEIPSDLEFGETLALCALLSSGELLVAPSLPEEGIGEAEDNRILKRKFDCSEPDGGGTSKKLRTSFPGEGEITSRRPKGFPGVKMYLHRVTMSRLHAIDSFVDEDTFLDSNVNEHVSSDSGESIHLTNVSESPWEAMTSYAGFLMSSCSTEVKSSFLHPNSIETLYSAIQKSGDRGLSMKEISKILNIEEDQNMLEMMVDVLEAFGKASKVNAYNSIHVVDSLYRSKYFLSSVPVTSLRDRKTEKNEDDHTPINLDNSINNGSSENESHVISDEVHKSTMLNLPEDVADQSEVLRKSKKTGYKHDSEVAPSNTNRGFGNFELHSADRQTCRPMLPWMNGDGTINEVVYKQLISTVLRIVMQNPGILEDDVIKKMNCLNPQSCRSLLEIMILDNHISTRKLQQKTSTQPPSILGNLLGDNFKKSKFISRVHLFANPKSASFL